MISFSASSDHPLSTKPVVWPTSKTIPKVDWFKMCVSSYLPQALHQQKHTGEAGLSMVKSTGWSSTEFGFGSQHPHGGSRPSVTPGPSDCTLLSSQILPKDREDCELLLKLFFRNPVTDGSIGTICSESVRWRGRRKRRRKRGWWGRGGEGGLTMK